MSATRGPRRSDLDDLSMRELVTDWQAHISALVDARYSTGARRAAEEVADHALDALAVGEHLAGRMMASRWVTVQDALTHGATVDEVAAAMALTAPEVVVGLMSWAHGQYREHLMTAADRDAVVALLDGAR